MNDIPDEWGTAVNVQSMVFGNLGETSGTGVCFNEQFLSDDTHVENLLLKYNILDAAYERPCYQLDGSATEITR